MNQIVGIIEIENGLPVRLDEAGTEVEFRVGPYLLSDGVSLEAPLPVTFTDRNYYVDTAGNLRGVWPVNIVEPSVNWDWQPFTVRTGDSGAWIGYSNGDIVSPPFNPPVGTITNEPTAITQLEAIFQDASGDIVVVFQGDWRTQLDGVVIAFDAEVLSPQGYSLQGGNTFLRFSGYSGTVAVDTSYTVEFQPDPPIIENPTIGPLTEGDLLGDKITWGNNG